MPLELIAKHPPLGTGVIARQSYAAKNDGRSREKGRLPGGPADISTTVLLYY